jgi:hypothetical protein
MVDGMDIFYGYLSQPNVIGTQLSVYKEEINLILLSSIVVVLAMLLMVAFMVSWQSVDWDGRGCGRGG